MPRTSLSSRQGNTPPSRQLAKLIAGFAHSTKAEDIVILDMRKVTNFCDYFVIGTASSDRRILAIADSIEEGLSERGVKVRFVQGKEKATWVILDVGDVVTHIFTEDMRGFYGLEHLWSDAKRVPWKK